MDVRRHGVLQCLHHRDKGGGTGWGRGFLEVAQGSAGCSPLPGPVRSDQNAAAVRLQTVTFAVEQHR